MPDYLDHLIFPNAPQSFQYTPFSPPSPDPRAIFDRQAHGRNIRNAFNEAVDNFTQGKDLDFVYLEFNSAVNFHLKLESFENREGDIKLASCKKIDFKDDSGNDNYFYKVAVYIHRSGIPKFLQKIQEYLNKDTNTGKPRQNPLIANIEEIKAATLESFWQEPVIRFPSVDNILWWEVWLIRDAEFGDDQIIENIINSLEGSGAALGQRRLFFPEHIVVLIRGTVNQLASSILYTPHLAELRKPAEAADFFTSLTRSEEKEIIDDLVERTNNVSEESNISVCLLDTGVNNSNPLLAPHLNNNFLDTINPGWSTADSYHQDGHGTPMAGLILYGDLIEPLGSFDPIQINHHLESIKILEQHNPNEERFYGPFTQEAVARAEIMNPFNNRITCMAVTADNYNNDGKPTSWSSAIDQLCYLRNAENQNGLLFFISGGNLPTNEIINYPIINDEYNLQDPGQSYNALTVGACTTKDYLDYNKYPGAEILANRGGMAPSSLTSKNWNNQWPKKPDIVMEGGNAAIWNDGLCDHESLKLLSTGKGGIGQSWLTAFGDSSASTALASKMAGEIYNRYPNLWPETIRGLIIHSAYWTDEMLGNKDISSFQLNEKLELIEKVGYGIPDEIRANYSLQNALTLIAERVIQPFREEESQIKMNEFHLFDLPWPSDLLENLGNTKIRMTVTLSYYIEPNPGNKQYALASSYRSHGLRFKMKDTNEGTVAFRQRIGKALREEDYISEGKERWIIGPQVRDKGSIHKDFWSGTALELASKNKLAIHPVSGWWKNRKKLKKYNQRTRYSLIISIETPETDIDLYTPIRNQISIEL